MITLSLLAGLSLLTVTAAAAANRTHPDEVFDTEDFMAVFDTLKKNGCLTSDFHLSNVAKVSHFCSQIVVAKAETMANCGTAPDTALHAHCLSITLGTTSADGTFFNKTLLEEYIETFTSNSDWIKLAKAALSECHTMSDVSNTVKQQAVSVYTCWKMKLTSNCDSQQDQRGALAEEGQQRRVRFLAGSYTLSPITLVTVFGLVTEDTWDKCTTFTAYATDVTSSYEAELGRVVCLLQDVTSPDGTIDFDNLTSAISGTAGKAGNTAVNKLLNIVEGCKSDDDLASTAEEFAKCWASAGVESRACPEASKLASTLPETCTILY